MLRNANRLFELGKTPEGRSVVVPLAEFRDLGDAIVFGKNYAVNKKTEVLHLAPADANPIIYSYLP